MTRGAKWFKDMLKECKKDPLFETEGLIIELEEKNISLLKRVEDLERRLAEYETKYDSEIHVESEQESGK